MPGMVTTVADALAVVLHQPDPAALVGLQEALLANCAGSASREQALSLAGQFHGYLSELNGKLTAREYSQLASWLDISAVGVVAFEELIKGEMSGIRDLLIGVLAELLMVSASRQYVKAWDVEARLIHGQATWHLRDALWRLSEEFQPDMPPAARLEAIRSVLAPAVDEQTPPEAKIVLVGRLFQTILLIHVVRLLGPAASAGAS